MTHVGAVLQSTSASAAAESSPTACTAVHAASALRVHLAHPRRLVTCLLLLALLCTCIARDVASWLVLEAHAVRGAPPQRRGLDKGCRLSHASRHSLLPELVLFAYARPAAADPRSDDHEDTDDYETRETEDESEVDEERAAALRRDLWGAVAQYSLLDLNYETGLKPFLIPWREARRMLRDAGCHTTMGLPRPTYPPRQHHHQHHRRSNRTDGVSGASPLPALCRKPLVLMSGRSTQCGSCTNFARDVLSNYRAELEYVRTHVTLVDAGDPMSEQLIRYAYPLWHDPAALQQRLRLTKVLSETDSSRNASRGFDSSDSGDVKLRDMQAAMRQSEKADYSIFDTELRQRAALLVRAPASQASHRWSKMIEDAYAGQGEYLLRIIFAYPHNGSVMRDVVNEEVTVSWSAAANMHFFATAAPFFHCAKKAVRVMERLQSHGDY